MNVNKKFWDKSFKNNLKGQRFFPNEELCRFLGRNFNVEKKKINLLELGCGTGSNINAFLHYKMNVTGIDISGKSIEICSKKFPKNKNVKFLKIDMLDIDKLKNNFDVIVDVFSSYNLNYNQGNLLIKKIYKKLNKGGYFFSYTPSKKSTSWIKEKNRFDNSTLKGFKRPHSPFFNNEGFFRFVYLNEYKKNLMKNKFKIKYMEKTSRTYNNLKEYFEFIIVEAKK